MKMATLAIVAAVLAVAQPAIAQDDATAADSSDGGSVATETADEAAPVDPVRLAAARRIIDIALPPEEARAMISSLVGSAFDEQIATMRDDEEFKQSMRDVPAMRAPFDAFIADMRRLSETVMADATPALLTATAEVYAERYSVGELGEIEAFLSTPTGRRYSRDAFDMMQDPRILRWARAVTSRLEQRAAPVLERFIANITRLATKGVE